MESIRKIFTGLDFGGRCIKNVKIDDQPYYVPFNFSDDNANTPVPQEIVDELTKIYNDSITKGIIAPTIYLNRAGYFQKAIILEVGDIGIMILISDMNVNINLNMELPKFNFIGIHIDISSDNTWMCLADWSYDTLFKIINIDDNINHFNALSTVKFAILTADNCSYLASVNMDQYGTRATVECVGYNHFFNKFKHIKIKYTNDSIEILKNEDIEFGGSGASFYTLDLNNYTTNIFTELSAMTLGTTIQVIDKSGRPCLYQIADHEPDYVTINSYMRYDDDDEDPEILSYTLRANGTIAGPTVRIRLETMGGGEKFLSDLGRYKEIKIPELINAKVTQAEYNAMESAGTLDNNTIYYIMG